MAKEYNASKVASRKALDHQESVSNAEEEDNGFGRITTPHSEVVDRSLMGRLKRVVQGWRFNTVIGLLILLNGILIGASSDLQVRCAFLDEGEVCDRHMTEALDLSNTMFTVVFSLELAVRVFVSRLEFYRAEGWQWNVMDTIVVVISLLEEAAFAGGSFNLKYVRLLRLSRLVRTVRMVRTLPFFMTLRTMLNAIMNSLSSFLWAMVLVWFTLFMFAVAFTQGAAQYAESATAAQANKDFLKTFFPSLGMTLLTLFMCITGGLNWWEVIEALSDIHALFGVLFAFYICLMVLALLNIVTGIFVNEALELAKMDRDFMTKIELDRRQADIEKLDYVFRSVDVSRTGKINLEQFLVHMDNVEVKALFTVMGLDYSDLLAFFEALDVGGHSQLTREEFVMGCMNLRGSAKTLDIATLMRENKRIMERLENHSTRLEAHLNALELRFSPSLRRNEVAPSRRKEGVQFITDVSDTGIHGVPPPVDPVAIRHTYSQSTLSSDAVLAPEKGTPFWRGRRQQL